MAEQSLLGVQGIHPWNGHGYFCGQGKYDGKANLVGVQGKIRKTWQNTLCWGFRGFTPGTGMVIFVDKGNMMVKQPCLPENMASYFINVCDFFSKKFQNFLFFLCQKSYNFLHCRFLHPQLSKGVQSCRTHLLRKIIQICQSLNQQKQNRPAKQNHRPKK